MSAQGITRTELARRLGLQENGVRRLLDLDHRLHIDQLERALAALASASRYASRSRRGPLPQMRERKT
ncbi:MAG: hypothetical protein K0R41_1453 [Geminicoccaceae bacterium]|jgi:hypothetical protein|nr:hypothetical protein [Geminicoccaceae bacterium]MCE3247628.1 hypothetical protein [Geminicoccaceae bacterium]